MSKIYKISSLVLFLILNACSQQAISEQLLRECKQEYQQQQNILKRLESMNIEYTRLAKERFFRWFLAHYGSEEAFTEYLETTDNRYIFFNIKRINFRDSADAKHFQVVDDLEAVLSKLDEYQAHEVQQVLDRGSMNDLLDTINVVYQEIEEKYFSLPNYQDFRPEELKNIRIREKEELNKYLTVLLNIEASEIEGITVIEAKLLINSMLICSYNLRLLYYRFLFNKTELFWRYRDPYDRPQYSIIFPHSMYYQLTPLNPQRGQAFQVDSYLMYHINCEFVQLNSVDISLNGKALNLHLDRYSPLGAQTFAKKDLAKIQDLVIEAEYTDRWDRTNSLKDTFYYQTCTN